MHVIDFTIYKSTGHRIEYGDPLGQALQDIDKANRAAEECIALFSDRQKVRAEQKWKPKLRDFYPDWWPGGAA